MIYNRYIFKQYASSTTYDIFRPQLGNGGPHGTKLNCEKLISPTVFRHSFFQSLFPDIHSFQGRGSCTPNI